MARPQKTVVQAAAEAPTADLRKAQSELLVFD
jgi:hypothetical protein